MNLTINGRHFRPSLLPSILAILFFCLFLSLGFWQLDRAEYKRELHTEFVKKNTAEAIALQEIIAENAETYLWRPAIAQGVFGKGVNILLDNQVVKTQAGYFVYTPLQLLDSDKWVMVNRGWLAAGHDRSVIPEIKQIETTVSLKGVIKELPKTGILLQEAVPEKMNKDIIRVQKLDLNQVEQLLDIKLLPFIFRLDPESEHGFVRDWPVPGSGEEMHKGYAFQWFAFAATLFVIFIILSFKKVDI